MGLYSAPAVSVTPVAYTPSINIQDDNDVIAVIVTPCLYVQCCRRHVVGQWNVGDVSVVVLLKYL